MRTLIVLLAAVGILPGKVTAGEKPLEATFVRAAGDLQLKMVFRKDSMMDFHITLGKDGCVMICKYTRGKNGVHRCEMTRSEKTGAFPITKEKGYRFSFRLHIKPDRVLLSDLEGDGVTDDQRKAVEGEYKVRRE